MAAIECPVQPRGIRKSGVADQVNEFTSFIEVAPVLCESRNAARSEDGMEIYRDRIFFGFACCKKNGAIAHPVFFH